MLDALGLTRLEASGVPVDLTGIEDGVAALADVDERRLHRGKDVLHAAEIDVAGHRDVGRLVDVVLHEHAVLEHTHLGAALTVAHDHDPVDGLATGEELGLGDDGAAASGLAALAAALLLGLEAGRALDAGRLVADRTRLAHAGRHAGGVVARVRRRPGAAATPTTPARGALVVVGVGPVTVLGILVVLGLLTGRLGVVGGVGGGVGRGAVVTGSSSRSDEARPRRPFPPRRRRERRGVDSSSTSTGALASRSASSDGASSAASSTSSSGWSWAGLCGTGGPVGRLGRRGDGPGVAHSGAATAGGGGLGSLEQQAEARHGGAGDGALRGRLVLGGLLVDGAHVGATSVLTSTASSVVSAVSSSAAMVLSASSATGSCSRCSPDCSASSSSRAAAARSAGSAGSGLRPRGALAGRPLGRLLGGGCGNLAAFATLGSLWGRGVGGVGRVGGGDRAHRRRARPRPMARPQPSWSCAWRSRACASCASSARDPFRRRSRRRPRRPHRPTERRASSRRCCSRWVWCRWVPSGSLPSGAV